MLRNIAKISPFLPVPASLGIPLPALSPSVSRTLPAPYYAGLPPPCSPAPASLSPSTNNSFISIVPPNNNLLCSWSLYNSKYEFNPESFILTFLLLIAMSLLGKSCLLSFQKESFYTYKETPISVI